MRLTLVQDAPRSSNRAVRTYVERAVEACALAAGTGVAVSYVSAVPDDQPGGKTPVIGEIRRAQEWFLDRLHDSVPDVVVPMGTAALQAVVRSTTPPKLKQEHGRMRMTPLYSSDGTLVREVPMVPSVDPRFVLKNSDLHRDFTNVLYKALSQREPLPPMDVDVHVLTATHQLDGFSDLLDGATVVGVDVETGGLSAYSDPLLMVGIGAVYDDSSGVAVVVPERWLGDSSVQEWLGDQVWRTSRRSVGHNFKFDMQFLERVIGFSPREALIGDTLLLAHLLDERPTRMNSRARGSGLKDLVAQRYDYQYGFDFEPTGEYTDEQLEEMAGYLGDDVAYTARLWHDEAREAEEESPRLLELHDSLLMPAARAIAVCEWKGAPVDLPWVEETVHVLDRRIERRQRALEASINKLVVTLVVDNVLSTQQVADAMYDEWQMTPDIRKHGRVVEGDRSTDKDHVEAAVAKYLGGPKDRQARWLRSLQKLRKDTKVRTTYQKSLLDRADSDARVRASFLLHGTSTGRLSAQGPALQTIPAVKRVGADQVRPMRRAFAPGPGRAWCDVDYSQLELRVAAAVSGDQALADVFRGGRDVHREIASSIFSRPPEEVTEAQRFLAKAVSFGIIYGRSARALASGTEMEYAKRELGMTPWTEDQAELFIKKFLRSYPDLTAWIERTHRDVPRQGYVESPFGRRRRFPLALGRGGELESIQRQAVNTPIQSAASDICLRALVDISSVFEDEERDDGPIVLFPVHDSICIECATEQVPDVESVCRSIMERDFMGVPLTVDFKSGPDWATANGWHGK